MFSSLLNLVRGVQKGVQKGGSAFCIVPGTMASIFVNNNVQPRLSQFALGSLINRTGIGIASIPILLLQFLLRLKFRFAYVISILSS